MERPLVNLLTVHDCFTPNDLVSCDHMHNEANGEDNRDVRRAGRQERGEPRVKPVLAALERALSGA